MCSVASQCRIVGLSASLASAKDVGDWIGATTHSLVSFRPDVRPVPLELRLHGFDVNHFGSRMLAMAKPAYNYVVAGTAGERRYMDVSINVCHEDRQPSVVVHDTGRTVVVRGMDRNWSPRAGRVVFRSSY